MKAEDVLTRTMGTRHSEHSAGRPALTTRLAAGCGLLSVAVSIAGFALHGYPAIGAAGTEIAHWAKTTDPQQFAVGIYLEAVGTLLFLPFAVWLWGLCRAEGGSGWISTTGFGAAVLYVGAIIDNGIWWGVFDAGRRGTNPQTLAAMRDIAQHVFDTSLLFYGAFLLTTGAVLIATRALPRWLGGMTVLCGLLAFIPAAQIGGLTEWVWPVVVGLCLLIRPSWAVSSPRTSVPADFLTAS